MIPPEENVQKIKAALDSRRDKDFVIIARCDALAVNGWEDTIRRCHAYYEAGADLVFVDGIRTADDLKRYANDLKDLPKLYNGGLLPTYEVADMGFKIMITGKTNQLIFKTVKEAFETLKEKGIVMEELKTADNDIRKNALDMLGLSAIYEMEKRYKC